MNGLADQLSSNLRLEIARLEALLDEGLIALRHGEWDRYMRAIGALRDTWDAIDRHLESSGNVDSAICTIDPAYGAFLKPIRIELAVEKKKREYSGLPAMALITAYVKHVIQCTDPDCVDTIALLQLLRVRGIEVPK